MGFLSLDVVGPLLIALLAVGAGLFFRKTGADSQKLKALKEIQDAVSKSDAIRRQVDLEPDAAKRLRDEWTKP